MPKRKLDLVGIDEIAERLKALGATSVTRAHVSQWQRRGWPRGGTGRPLPSAKPIKAPEPVAIISHRIAVYEWPDVERWARETGRLDRAKVGDRGANGSKTPAPRSKPTGARQKAR